MKISKQMKIYQKQNNLSIEHECLNIKNNMSTFNNFQTYKVQHQLPNFNLGHYMNIAHSIESTCVFKNFFVLSQTFQNKLIQHLILIKEFKYRYHLVYKSKYLIWKDKKTFFHDVIFQDVYQKAAAIIHFGGCIEAFLEV